MIDLKETITKIEEKKQIKRDKLLSSAYSLFIRKGFSDTSISDIVEDAGVAKGTFYLYFKDKFDIHEKVIIEKARLLFDEAIINTKNKQLKVFPERLINTIDYIIDNLSSNKELIKLISKNLSLGLYSQELYEAIDNEYIDIKGTFINGLKEYNKKIENPDVLLYMIIELVSSTCYNSILYNIPKPINEFKPFLYEQIKKMIK